MNLIKNLSKKKKIIIGVIMGVVVVGSIIFTSTKNKAAMGTNVKNAPTVQVHTVSKTPISSQISSVGTVEAKELEKIYSKTNATVEEVIAEVGDQVKAGDVILRFKSDTIVSLQRDLEKLNLQLASAELALNDLTTQGGKQEVLQAQTSLSQAQKSEQDAKDAIVTQELSIEQIKRELETSTKLTNDQKELLEAGIISKKDYDDAVERHKVIEDKLKTATMQLESTKQLVKTAEYQKQNAQYALDVALNNVTDKSKKQLISSKQNEIKSIKLQIEALKDEIEKANIEVKSPIDGVVSEVMVLKGAVVTQGSPLMTVLDISSLKVKSDISTFNAPQVKVGQEATIKQDSIEAKEYIGKVIEIAPAAVQKQSGTSSSNIVPVTIEIEDLQTDLKPGYNVDIKIKTVSKDEALTLPILAIMEDVDEDYKYVFIIKEDNVLEKRKVQELTLDNIYVEVVGVEEGERVVADPTEDLKEGMIVVVETGDTQ